MKELKTPYLKIETKDAISYGGNQAWFPYKFLQKTGCGVIGAADTLLHLSGKEEMAEEEYMEFAKMLWRMFLPVIPGFGMNGLTLMIGVNRYFQKNGMPYCARWRISGQKMFSRIDRMLAEDIPVILAVGPNFPFVWKKEKLTFYTKTNDEIYIPAVKTRAHFVIVTGRDGSRLKISSWGKEYYIDIREYRKYVKQHSSFLVSNILDIH